MTKASCHICRHQAATTKIIKEAAFTGAFVPIGVLELAYEKELSFSLYWRQDLLLLSFTLPVFYTSLVGLYSSTF
jgi:hypothetical protein